MCYIFRNNYHLCNEISDRVVHHFVHCIETHGRHVEYLRFLQTIVKADGKYVKECQCKIMNEVRWTLNLMLHGDMRNSYSKHTLIMFIIHINIKTIYFAHIFKV